MKEKPVSKDSGTEVEKPRSAKTKVPYKQLNRRKTEGNLTFAEVVDEISKKPKSALEKTKSKSSLKLRLSDLFWFLAAGCSPLQLQKTAFSVVSASAIFQIFESIECLKPLF